MSFLIVPGAGDFRDLLRELRPSPGYCVFGDIVGSTSLKERGLSDWVRLIYNAFATVQGWLAEIGAPLKGLGDSLMFFAERDDFRNRGMTPLGLFARLASIAAEGTGEPILPVRIGACYCEESYDISFLPNARDVYGRDIDLAARLVAIAEEGEVVINAPFAHQIQADYGNVGNQDDFTEITRLVGPWPVRPKGFTTAVSVYKLPASTSGRARAS
ncbi:MAG: hypothetical protein Q7W02_11725 [Candidatus Rokubacteria bacterium]|nr:hypothetical protein [Candidatus Rokubacteria bacterium]